MGAGTRGFCSAGKNAVKMPQIGYLFLTKAGQTVITYIRVSVLSAIHRALNKG